MHLKSLAVTLHFYILYYAETKIIQICLHRDLHYSPAADSVQTL